MAAAAATPMDVDDDTFVEPTADELANLRTTQELFRSNLFKLQIDELMGEIRPTETMKTVIDEMLRSFQDALPEDEKHVIGSYLLETMARPITNVDVAVCMPKALVYAKDHLNRRYFNKRGEYLQTVLKKLQATFSELRVSYFRGDREKPILIAPRRVSKRCVVVLRVFVVVGDESHLMVDKLAPGRNAERSCKIPLPTTTTATAQPEVKHVPTPLYNMRVLEDVYMVAHMHRLHTFVNEAPVMAEASMLLKVWHYQRFGVSSQYGFNGFLLTMLLMYMTQKRLVNRNQSAYQIFRVALRFIAQHDMHAEPLFLDDIAATGTNIDVAQWQAHFPVVFIDHSGRLNLAARVTAAAYTHLRYEAQRSVDILDPPVVASVVNNDGTTAGGGGNEDDEEMGGKTGVITSRHFDDVRHESETQTFQALFTTRILPVAKFDVHFHIRVPVSVKKILLDQRYRLVSPVHPTAAVHRLGHCSVYDLVTRALGKRARLVAIIDEHNDDDDDGGGGGNKNNNITLHVGVCLDPKEAHRVVELGPPANDNVEAPKFRAFWGALSEIRRFKDGSIVEAVVWQTDRPHHIVRRIVEHILARHWSLDRASVSFVGDNLDFALQPPSPSAITGNNGDVMSAFERLKEMLRSMPHFPLSIISVQAVHSAFAGANAVMVRKVRVRDLNNGLEDEVTGDVVDVLLQFESSSSWPDDLLAIEHIKRAFYIRIASTLQRLYPNECATVSVDRRFVDIVLQSYAFRVTIYHTREVAIQKGAVQAERLPSYDEKVRLAALDRSWVHLPHHVSTIRSVHNKYPVFAGACQLGKRWLSAHHFHQCLADEAVELLIAYVCCSVDAQQYGVSSTLKAYSWPGSVQCVFYRFLYLLAHHDWLHEPLAIDLVEMMTHDQYIAITNSFREQRQQRVGALMFLGTASDPHSMVWTHDSPRLRDLERLVKYARSSCKTMEALVNGGGTTAVVARWPTLFKTPLRVYDLFIELRVPAVLGNGCWLGVDLVHDYMSTLRRSFGHLAWFGVDTYSSNQHKFIVVKWHDNVLTAAGNDEGDHKKTFSVTAAQYAVPVFDDTSSTTEYYEKVRVNTAEVVRCMIELGSGLVTSITNEAPIH